MFQVILESLIYPMLFRWRAPTSHESQLLLSLPHSPLDLPMIFFFQGYGRIRFSAGPFDCNSLEFANESSSEWRLRFPLFFGDKWQFNDSDWGRREPLILQRFDLSLEATEKPRFSGLSMRPKFPCGFGFSAWSQPKKRFPPKKISRICLNV